VSVRGRGRVEALLKARAAAHLASLQVGMTQENITVLWKFILIFSGKIYGVYFFHYFLRWGGGGPYRK
jgi:hypothetical protein